MQNALCETDQAIQNYEIIYKKLVVKIEKIIKL